MTVFVTSKIIAGGEDPSRLTKNIKTHIRFKISKLLPHIDF